MKRTVRTFFEQHQYTLRTLKDKYGTVSYFCRNPQKDLTFWCNREALKPMKDVNIITTVDVESLKKIFMNYLSESASFHESIIKSCKTAEDCLKTFGCEIIPVF